MEKYNRTMGDHSVKLVMICLVVVMYTNQHQVHAAEERVPFTYLTNAVEKGAVCNDGTPATYYYSPGFGEGVNNWNVYLNGGAWCYDDQSCRERLTTPGGSSKYNSPTIGLGQIRSRNQTVNPDFYNWNEVYVMYCDSSSFMGILDHPNFAGRGERIFYAIMEELLQKGMANASNAMLYGSSAGGLSTILHCDDFRALVPNNSTRVKCLSDSGFFLHAPKLNGAEKRAEYYGSVAAYHGFTNKLPQPCTSKMNASLCIFPQYIVEYIQTPLFLLESKFDRYQLGYQFVSDDTDGFNNCLLNTTICTPAHRQSIKEYGVALTEILQEIRESSSIEMFVLPYLRHVHFYDRAGWYASYKLRNKTVAQAVGDWFYDRDTSFQEIDTDHELPLVPIPINSQNYVQMKD